MPEATVDENYGTVLREYDIGLTRQTINMESEPVSEAVNQAPHPLLDIGILSPDVRHDLASL